MVVFMKPGVCVLALDAIFALSFAHVAPLWGSSDCDLSTASGALWNVEEKECWYDYLFYLGLFCVAMMYLTTTAIAKMANALLIWIEGFAQRQLA